MVVLVNRGGNICFEPNESSKDTRLYRRLICPNSAQFVGSVCREQEKGHLAVMRLEHRWHEVGYSCTAGGNNRRRAASLSANAKRKKRSTAFVDAYMHSELPALFKLPCGERKRL